MLRSYFFTEMPYPHIPPPEVIPAVRISIPNKWFDPDTGSELLNRYLDLFMAADEFGLDIMLNEHHATSTCLNSTVPLHMAILARQTKQARLLALGNPVGNRAEAIRTAEEMATCDVLSHGRIDVGFVRGSIMEILATNANPVFQRAQMWEAIDLIIEAWTRREPFSWEGEYFSHRQVNIWPRPYQAPHPPVWMTTLTPSSATQIAERDMTIATMMVGTEPTAEMFRIYRAACAERGRPVPPLERFAYSGMGFVGDSEAAGHEGAYKVQEFYRNQAHTPFQYMNVPGYIPAQAYAGALKRQIQGGGPGTSAMDEVRLVGFRPIPELIAEGKVFAGTPDSVFEQLRDFFHAVGGYANILLMMHAGTMANDLTLRSMELYATEVLPRLRAEVYEPFIASGDAEEQYAEMLKSIEDTRASTEPAMSSSVVG
jgi:alkanesulfonate monooxygenase SsuD/methylene tetrahydromethanopterin reductase-like flavin-dependent oxidoreductase (luciferase family)